MKISCGGIYLQPWPVNFDASMFLQPVMRNVAHHADNLAPRLIFALEAQPSPKRRVHVTPEMIAHKLIVDHDHRRRVERVSFGQHMSRQKRNAERTAATFIDEQGECHRPLDRIRRLWLA